MSRTQLYRPIAVGTPLGEDVLLLRSFSMTEQLHRPFTMELDLVSEIPDIPFEAIVGQNVTVRLDQGDGQTRYFNGYVSRFVQMPVMGRLTSYHATVVPWIWFLSRCSDCRIFQDKKVPDIVKEILKEHGYTDIDDRLTGDYRTWEYCVQYRETDLNFIHRLLEQEGIYYYFRHENGKHTLVLADSAASHEPAPGYETIEYMLSDEAEWRQRITQWTVEQEVKPGRYAHDDFDFEKPRKDLLTKGQIASAHAAGEWEIFDYPGEYTEVADGEAYARRRIEEFHAHHETVSGGANARGLSAGFTFQLTGFPRADQNRAYLVTSATISATNEEYDSETGLRGGGTFGCSFTAIPLDQPFRPARSTPRPIISGPQTAIVVGPPGEEIYTDKYGRVKVMFHWDRYAKADENSSCWIRVAQSWAGKKWGALYIPRIGQEVIVEFLEGDPDRPIITGRVYNGQEMPPYDLPDHKTRSTLKSNSTKGGEGFNEIRFEDKKGEEQLFIHAQKDQDVRVLNDSREWIGRDRHLIVKRDQRERVEQDKHTHVRGDWNIRVDGTGSFETGGESHTKADSNFAAEAGMDMHLKAGLNLVIEAGVMITLKAGAATINIGPTGILLCGVPILSSVPIYPGAVCIPMCGGGCRPDAPTAPDEAAQAEPGQVSEPPPPPPEPEPAQYSSSAQVLQRAAVEGTPFCEICSSAASEVQEEAADQMLQMQQQAAQGLLSQVSGLTSSARELVDQAQSQVSQAQQALASASGVPGVQAAQQGLGQALSQIGGVQQSLANAQGLMAGAAGMASGLPSVMGQVQNQVSQAQGALVQAQTAVAQVQNQVTSLASQVQQQVQGAVQAVAGQVQQAVQGLAGQVQGLAQGLTGQVQGLAQGLAGQVQGLLGNAQQMMSQALGNLTQALELPTSLPSLPGTCPLA